MMSKQIVMRDSPEAAQYRTDLKGGFHAMASTSATARKAKNSPLRRLHPCTVRALRRADPEGLHAVPRLPRPDLHRQVRGHASRRVGRQGSAFSWRPATSITAPRTMPPRIWKKTRRWPTCGW